MMLAACDDSAVCPSKEEFMPRASCPSGLMCTYDGIACHCVDGVWECDEGPPDLAFSHTD
jgi:hypothetical protein